MKPGSKEFSQPEIHKHTNKTIISLVAIFFALVALIWLCTGFTVTVGTSLPTTPPLPPSKDPSSKNPRRHLVTLSALHPLSPHTVIRDIKGKFLNNVNMNMFIMAGWKMVLQKDYLQAITNEELLSIYNTFDKKRIACVGGKSASSTDILLAACAEIGDIFIVTSSSTQTRLIGEVYWYFYTSNSFGFSGVSTVSLNTADTSSGPNKLSWHIGSGGYRLVDMTSLDSTWLKFIMIAPL